MSQAPTGSHSRVVIIGAGFGGLTAAKRLANTPLDVTVVDQHNYHLFQPLLYQVATASLSPADIASPIRGIVRNVDNVKVVLAKVSGIDVTRQEVVADGRRIPFDDLASEGEGGTALFYWFRATALTSDIPSTPRPAYQFRTGYPCV